MRIVNRCTIGVLLGLSISCSKNEEDPIAKLTKEFVGVWSYSYTVNCGAGIQNYSDDVVITKSDSTDLNVVIPQIGAFGSDIYTAFTDPTFTFTHEDSDGVFTYAFGSIVDGELELDGYFYDDEPFYYCAFSGIGQKQ
jgi:hypothetical protein